MTNLMVRCMMLSLFFTPVVLAQTTQPAGAERTTPSGLKIVEVKKLTEAMTAQTGDKVWVHYSGRLPNSATPFDSSIPRGEPLAYILGAENIIKGWNEGIVGMKVGEKRKLIIPPDLGYGAAGRPPRIPPNSTMEFDVELIGIERPEKK